MIRQQVIDYLKQAPDEELLEILQRVFESRQPNAEEAAYNRNRFFLATASSLLHDRTGRWDPWEIEAVAYRDPALWPSAAPPFGRTSRTESVRSAVPRCT
jgi:hypothetical protein